VKEMDKNMKRVMTGVIVAAMVVGAQMTAFAAEDDIVDEAEIYLSEFRVRSQPIQPPQQELNIMRSSVEGTKTSDISNSPAVLGDNAMISTDNTDNDTDADNDTNDTDIAKEPIANNTDNTTNSPNTGAPSMMLPIGIGLMALGCIPAAMSRKER